MLSLLQFALISGLLLALALSALMIVLEHPLRHLLAGTPPAQRANLLWWILVAPTLAGIASVVAVLFSPPLFGESAALAATCKSHSNQLLHWCVWHPHNAGQSAWLWTLLAALLSIGLWLAIRAARGLWHARQRLLALVRLGRRSEHSDHLHILDTERPLALACGIGQPRILLSRDLIERLDPLQLRVLLAHEQSHISHRDLLSRLFAASFSRLHWPGVRRRLLRDLELALEQRCDLAAAKTVGSALAVAKTIVAVERLFHGGAQANTEAGMAFVSSFVPERVEALLAPEGTASPYLGGLLTATLVALCALSVGWLHHTTETLMYLLAR